MFLVLIIASLKSIAQQSEILMPMEQDSTQIQLEKQIEYRQLISGQMFPELHGETISLTGFEFDKEFANRYGSVSYTHLRAHETVLDLVCRLLLEKKKTSRLNTYYCIQI